MQSQIVIDLTLPEETRPESQSPKKRKKNSGGENKSKPTSREISSEHFYVDIVPTPLPPSTQVAPSQKSVSEETQVLVLPSHVSVFGNDASIINIGARVARPGLEADNEDEFIEYLDFDDRKNFTRYFEEQSDENTKTVKVVCKACGAEGDHRTSDCPVKICLTCGARNEHATISCPVGKTCFNCGMRGHLKSDCPNPASSRLARSMSKYDDCDRCGSKVHASNECPTYWRLYQYIEKEERDSILATRQSKMKLDLGDGGEGYIADDEWCYNCGGRGHWGDHCKEVPHNSDFPSEPSAFSFHNIASGPFFDPSAASSSSKSSRRARDWEQSNGWHDKVPDAVGKKGRLKDMAKLKHQERMIDEDDPDDWFGNAKNKDIKDSRRDRRRRDSSHGKMSFGSLAEPDRWRRNGSLERPTLMERMGVDDSGSRRLRSSSQRSQDNGRRTESRRERDKDDRRRDRDRHDRDRLRVDDEKGPRYKGGYAR